MPETGLFDKVETPHSLKERAYTAIKDAIVRLRLEPGAPIVETTLAEQLGISKTPVRDALQELEREGFVARILYKGTYVTDVSIKDIAEVFQLRAVLEGLAARLAAPLFADRELDEIGQYLTAAEAALADGDPIVCSENGRKLHYAIIDKSEAENPRLARIIRNLDDHVRRFRALSDRISGRLHKSVEEHRRVLAALYDRDPGAAEQAMRDHLFSVLCDLQVSAEQPCADWPPGGGPNGGID
jgi:DNA-binding GntR family transcriptional regulator